MLSSFKKHLRWIFFTLVIAAIGVYFYYNRQDLALLHQFQPRFLAFIFVTQFLYLALFGVIFQMLIARFNVRLGFHEALGLLMTKHFSNYFMPAHLGITTTSYYLKKNYNLSYTAFGVYFAGQTVLVVASNAFWGLCGTFMAARYVTSPRVIVSLVLFFTACLIGILCFVIIVPKLRIFGVFRGKWLGRLLENWQHFDIDRRLVVKMFLLGLVGYIIQSATISLGFKAFGLDIPYRAAFVAGVLNSFIYYINLTPANLGIQESFFALMSKMYGFDFSQGLIVCAVNRLVQMVIICGSMPIYSLYLTRRKKHRIEGDPGA